MITAARLRQKLNSRPFEPFRIFVSDGAHYDVPHPEFAWVWGGRLFIGMPKRNGSGHDMAELSILHVTRLEDLRPAKRQKK
ncbi:hypothetical protein BH20VER2_BH20VER2_04470 [soil metagenome]|nr:hypothetical protein [Chthoniobacterales bacterium]